MKTGNLTPFPDRFWKNPKASPTRDQRKGLAFILITVVIYFCYRFGGDSKKVTIFGESSGGMSVALLLLSPLASGLYQNVIIQSGTAVTLSALFEKDEAELRAR